MTLTPAQIGLLAGAVFGLVNFAILRSVAARSEGMSPTPEKRRGAGIIRLVAWIDLIVFPLVGYFVAPMVLE